MKSVTYPVRFRKDEYDRLMAEARRRRKTLADLLRDLVTYGLPALPPPPDWESAILDTWDKLGPAPEVNYDQLEAFKCAACGGSLPVDSASKYCDACENRRADQ
jgi:hypothetical protein